MLTGLRNLIESEPDFAVVGEAASGPEAFKVIRETRPDIAIVDISMPGMSGIELIDQLRQRQMAGQVVMVTAHASVASAVDAMRHGAFDYIEKPFDVDALEREAANLAAAALAFADASPYPDAMDVLTDVG